MPKDSRLGGRDHDSARVVLLFDIDGTLIDSAGAGGGALLGALQAAFGVQDPVPVALHGRTDLGIMTELLEKHGIQANTANLEKLCQVYFQALPAEMLRRGGSSLPGVEQLLASLRVDPRCHLGLLTGNMPASARIKLEHFGLWHYFKFGVYGDLAVHRPHLAAPAMKLIAEQVAAEVPASNIVIIGDTPLDIELARAMGARCLAVCTGGFEAQDLQRAGAHRVHADLTEVESILAWLTSLECQQPI